MIGMDNARIVSNTLNLRLSFQREVQDLLANGYCVLFNSDLRTSKVTKLRHAKSGRVLTLTLCKNYWCIRDNGKVIKMVRPVVRQVFW